jgi:Skp family chaperone for outer membrane proteins
VYWKIQGDTVKIGVFLAIVLITAGVMAQEPVKDSVASQTLNKMAQQYAVDKAQLDTKTQQARSSLDASNKELNEKAAALQKQLLDQIRADKRYKPLLDQVDQLKKQSDQLNADAQRKFVEANRELMERVNGAAGQMESVKGIVRKENSLPEAATYDAATQTWAVPKK